MCARSARFASIFLSLLFLITRSTSAQSVMYVDVHNLTPGDGTGGWGNSTNNLSQALAAVQAAGGTFTEVRVAKGMYTPDTTGLGNPRDATFRLPSFPLTIVEIKGGYPGYNTANPNDRNVDINVTILSGEIGAANDPTDNCYHVVTARTPFPDDQPVTDGTRLDGFTVTGGWSDDFIGNGAGVLVPRESVPQIANCSIEANVAPCDSCYGGGMFIQGSGNGLTDVRITNTRFTGNQAGRGAGLACWDASPALTDCLFEGNASNEFGGGLLIWGYGNGINGGGTCAGSYLRCMFVRNYAEFADVDDWYKGGGGVYCDGSWVGAPEVRPLFRDCQFIENTSDHGPGGGVVCYHAAMTLVKCIWDGNVSGPRYWPTAQNGENAGFGGGMAADEGPKIIDGIFRYNRTVDGSGKISGLGGGLAIGKNLPELINTLFYANESGLGGGMYAFGDESPYTPFETGVFDGINCTFAENFAYGDGFYNVWGGGGFATGGGVFGSNGFRNSILWENYADGYTLENQVYVPVGALPGFVMEYSCIMDDDGPGNTIPFGGSSAGNLDDDPLFANKWNRNYRLKRCSPCIDRAKSTVIHEDRLDLNADGATVCTNANCTYGERMPDLDLRRRVLDEPTRSDNDGVPDTECMESCDKVADVGAYEFGWSECDHPGDINNDGYVNGNDFAWFEWCWAVGGGEYQIYCYCADMDGNGVVNEDDLPCFFQKLSMGWSDCDGDYECPYGEFLAIGGAPEYEQSSRRSGSGTTVEFDWLMFAVQGSAMGFGTPSQEPDSSLLPAFDELAPMNRADRWARFANWAAAHPRSAHPGLSVKAYGAWAMNRLCAIVLKGE